MSSKHILTAFIILLSVASCVRKQPVNPAVVNPVAGKGGFVKLVITPTHRGDNIDTAWVYLKYNATTKPADSVMFDDSMRVAMINGAYRASFDSLKRGNYYIHATGLDTFRKSIVKGGASFTIPIYDTAPKTYNLGLAMYDIYTGL